MDVQKEGLDARDPKYDDGFIQGMDALISFHMESGCCIIV
jgi:hypothetical protein